MAYYKSPIGILFITGTDEGLSRVDFADDVPGGMPGDVPLDKPGRANGKPGPDCIDDKPEPECVRECIKQLDEYFRGERQDFDLKLNISGTEFQKKVWEQLKKIPYGQTATYGEIAAAVGNPKACRAVGNANNKNKISIIIPCHRVIGGDGKLVGYGGGLWRKKWLLEHEKNISKMRKGSIT